MQAYEALCTKLIHSNFSFQFNGIDLFHWIDQSGSNHSFREIGNSAICDNKEPTLLEEVAEVSNKGVLPLTGFSYGSISYGNQELSVKIGNFNTFFVCKFPVLYKVGF